MSIALLKKETRQKLLSTQIVQSPFNIVKELFENAVDAKALSIVIKFFDFGLHGLTIIDDGRGIAFGDFPHLFDANTSSKISSEQLKDVVTLGFRGEALFAISNIAKILVESSTDDSGFGYSISSFDGQKSEIEPISHEKGTSINVSDIFCMLPVRKRYLETNIQDFYEKSLKYLKDFSLFSKIKISVSNVTGNRSKVIFTSSGNSFKDNIISLYGRELFDKLSKFQVDSVEDNIHIFGYISRFSLASLSSRPVLQTFSVNDRTVKLSEISKAIQKFYHVSFPQPLLPLFAIKIKIDPSLIDVNVEMDKSSVIFKDYEQIRDLVIKGIDICAKNHFENKHMITLPEIGLVFQDKSHEKFTDDIIPKVSKKTQQIVEENFDQDNEIDETENSFDKEDDICLNKLFNLDNAVLSSQNISSSKLDTIDKEKQLRETPINSKSKKTYKFVDLIDTELIDNKNLKGKENKCLPSTFEFVSLDNSQTMKFSQQPVGPPTVLLSPQTIQKADFLKMNLLGQFNNGFILLELDDEIIVVDQHAAHERINFEKLVNGTGNLNKQPLLKPVSLLLSSNQKKILLNHISVLNDIGFDCVEKNGEFFLLTVPVLFGKPLEELDMIQILDFLGEVGSNIENSSIKASEKVFAKLASKACRSSVMIGENLSNKHLISIIRQLHKLKHPWSCPHGRTTVQSLVSKSELRNFFQDFKI
eukprot:TRINITY_DN1247_c0_g1_i1.p1 TRINITY_DN1247_c0_g1~~TRINITY_DN1247_c0_g1_i1.p1  ORF type:complete len:702 (-),score=223.90 TRINITY_DN1247_c0_g1_i1:464-2569(-)